MLSTIRTRPMTDEYADGWERTFGKRAADDSTPVDAFDVGQVVEVPLDAVLPKKRRRKARSNE